MSKVDWITWKTDPKEIINPNKIQEDIIEYFQNYNTYMTPVVYEQIKYEINKGGLSPAAFNIMGISPANEIATDIINKIDEIKNVMKNLYESVYDKSEEQKKIEKSQLIQAIELKINKEKSILENILSNTEIQKRIISEGESPEDVIYIIQDRIKRLTERLERAKSL